ncbi:MAG: MFS transporter [Myxococcota bacterium]
MLPLLCGGRSSGIVDFGVPKEKSRWVVLAAYTAVAGVSQMLWLNFAPLLRQIQARYGVGELTASTLVLVFPFLYVVLSIPAGALIDRRGYRVGIGAGAVLQGAFSFLRIWDESFWVLLAAQLGIAVAQPFILNGISKLVSDWFEEEHGGVATGVGTMGMYLGMALAMAATPPLVEALGLSGAMAVFAAISGSAAVAFLVLVRERSQVPATGKRVRLAIRGNRDLLLLFGMSFLGLGFFNGITTWLEPLLARNGFDAVDAGAVGGAMIITGIFGAVVLPGLSDRLRRRKPFIIGCTAVALALLYPLGTTPSYGTLLMLGSLLGFFFLPAYAILLEMCSEVVGKEAAGMATGLLLLMGNAGGVAVVLAMPVLSGGTLTWSLGPLHLLAGLLVLAIVLASTVRETFHLRPATSG